MTADEFRRLVGEALRSGRDSPAGQLLIAALGAGGIDSYDAFELLALWVTEVLDPAGLGEATDAQREVAGHVKVPWPMYRLHGLEAAASREPRQ